MDNIIVADDNMFGGHWCVDVWPSDWRGQDVGTSVIGQDVVGPDFRYHLWNVCRCYVWPVGDGYIYATTVVDWHQCIFAIPIRRFNGQLAKTQNGDQGFRFNFTGARWRPGQI